MDQCPDERFTCPRNQFKAPRHQPGAFLFSLALRPSPVRGSWIRASATLGYLGLHRVLSIAGTCRRYTPLPEIYDNRTRKHHAGRVDVEHLFCGGSRGPCQREGGSLSKYLPSIRALQAFEAAARHLNFTRAAIELHLTQSAVSHRINDLEELLGVQLFWREGGKLRLTPAGEDYADTVRHIISDISLATERASFTQRQDTLTVACLTTFQSKGLLPKLQDFIQENRDLVLRFKTIDPKKNPGRPDFDVAIWYGVGDWQDVTVYKLGDETVFPVCSPALLEKGPPLRKPEDLQFHTIIRTGTPLLLRDDWPFWLQRAEVPDLEFAREMSFDLIHTAFQAAIEGLGVVMGRSVLVENDLRKGTLVEPFDIRLTSPASHYLVIPKGLETQPKVISFVEWCMATFSDPL